jgi:PKD repeat protein
VKPSIFTPAVTAIIAVTAISAAQPQGLYNSGTLTIPKGGVLYVQGSVINANKNALNILNRGELHLTGDLVNEAGVLFRASSSGADTVGGASKKTSGGAVRFVGQDTQRIVQRGASQGVLLNDVYHSNHLMLQGGSINVVGGLHFNGAHHIFNGGHDVRLFEQDSINHDLCRGYLSGERNSSRLYGSGKLYAIANDAARWQQLDSLGLGGIPRKPNANIDAVRVVRADSVIQETGDGSLIRYFDITIYGSNTPVSSFAMAYLPSQQTAYNATEESLAIFQKNLSNTSISDRYRRLASRVNTATRQVTATEPVRLTAGQTSRFTVASTLCANPPRVSLGADVSVCHGNPVTLKAALSNYDHNNRGAYLYRWRHGEATESVTLDALQPGDSSSYAVEVEDRFGCRGWDTITVRCHPKPSIDSMVVGPRRLQCENQPVALYAAASGCEGEVRYSWKITKTDRTLERAMDSIWGAQLLREQLAPGGYAVSLTCTSAKGCVSERSASIAIEQMPTVSIACERKSEYTYELRNESQTYSGASGTRWVVNGRPVPEASATYLHTFGDTGLHAIRLVANGAACTDSTDMPLRVSAYGMPSFATQKETYCAGEQVEYANTSSITGVRASYLWRFGDGSISQERRPVKAYARAGAFTDTLVATFPDGAVKRATRTIRVNPVPRAGFDADSVHTCGVAYELTVRDAAACRWSTGSTASSITATQSGRYSVALTSPQGCTATDSLYVALSARVKIDVGGRYEACGSARLDAQNPGSTYLWSTGSTARTLEATQSGAYSVRVTQPNGCTDSASVTLAIHPLPDARLGSRSLTLCENSSITLAPAYAPENAYLWSTGSAEPALRVEQAGVYSVRVSNGACSSTDTVRVYALPAQQVSLGGNRFLCNAEPALFTLPTYLSASSVRWYKQGEGLVSEQASYVTAQPGVYSVQLTYPNGCTVGDSVRVEHADAGVYVDFLVASEAEVGDTLLLIDLSYPDVAHRTWTTSDGFTGSENPLYHAFYIPGDKIVTLTAGNEQCASQHSKRISIVDRNSGSGGGGNGSEADSIYLLPSDSAPTLHPKTAKYVEIEEVKVYPNPSSGTFYVEIKLSAAADMLIELYSVTGALIRQIPVRSAVEHTEPFSFANSQANLYMVLVKAGSERKTVKIFRATDH